ncbi:hypothetical protein GC163_18815 [bacterium]|nr:hypothetical protein [bacterium]
MCTTFKTIGWKLWLLTATLLVPYASPCHADDNPATDLVPARRSFVPLKDLQTLVDRDRRGVLLPREQFEELLEQARKNGSLATAPPAAQALTHARYATRVVGDQLLMTITADLEQFVGGWKIWKFPLQRVAVEKATVDGQPAIIGRTNDQALTVVTSTIGKHQLELQLSTEIVTVGSDRVAGFSLLSSATGELSLTVEAGKRLVVDGAELERPQPIEQPAAYTVSIGGKAQIQLRITDRASDRSSDALTFATSGYGLLVAPGEVTWQVLTNLQVFGRPIDQLTLTVPGYLEIAEVESTGLDGWEIQDDPTNAERTRLTLTYGQPFEGSRKVSLRGVLAVPAGTPWSVPPLTIENISSHVGQVLVQYPFGIRLQAIEMDGIRRATEAEKPVSDMPEDMTLAAGYQRLRFDAWREEFQLRLVTEPKQREVHAAIAAVLDVSAAEVSLQAALTLTPRYAALFDVDIDLPAEWSVISATTGDNQSLTWQLVPQNPGTNRVRVTLATPLAPDASTVVRLSLRRDVEGWPVETEPVEFALPELVAPQANVVETALVVRGDPDLELVVTDTTGLDPAALKADWERLRFQSQDTRYAGTLQVSRKPARVAVETYGFYRLDPQTLACSLFSSISVEGGGTRQLLVTLPEATPETVRFQSIGATLVEQQALTSDNGRRVWRLQFAERILGRVAILVQFTLPRDPAAALSAPLLEVPQAERSHGAVVVEGGPEQRLTIVANDGQGQALQSMDPLELPPVPYHYQERIVGVYRTIGSGNTLSLTEERFDKAAIPTAICSNLTLMSILSRTGEWQQQATFDLQLAGVQQLQITLPPDAELWAATLNGDPVEIRKAGDQLLIPLPRDLTGVAEVSLDVYYRSTSAALKSSGLLSEVPPVLQAMTGQGSSQEVDVLEQNWNLIHPAETLIIDHQTALEPTTALDSPGWLAQLGHSIQLPSLKATLWTSLAMAVFLGVLAMVVLAYRRGGKWGALAGILTPIVVGMVLLCLSMTFGRQQRTANTSRATTVTVQQPAFYADEYMSDFAPPAATPAAPMAEGFQSKSVFESGGPEDAQLRRLSEFDKSQSDAAKQEAAEKKASGEKDAIQDRFGRVKEELRKNDGGAAMAGAPVQPAEQPPAPPQAEQPIPQLPQLEPKPENQGINANARAATRVLNPQRIKGRLSLALVMDRPADSVKKSFRYVGSAAAGTGIPLKVEYWDRRGGVVFRGFLLMLGLFAGWLLRNQPAAKKLGLAFLLLSIGLILLPVAPAGWQVTVDGLWLALLGMLLAWTLFGLGHAIRSICQCCQRVCSLLAWLLMLLAVSTSQLQAAEPETKPAPPAPLPPTQVLIYEDPAAPLAASRVFLPYDQFRKLYQLAHPSELRLPTAPITAKIVDSLYSATVTTAAESASFVRVRARYTILSYVDGQEPVALPVQGVIVKSASLNGQPAALITSATPWTILIPAPGMHVLDLDFDVPFTPQGTAGTFGLKIDPTPAARFDFQLPAPALSVRVNGSTSAYRRVTQDDTTHIEFPVDAGGELQVSWQPEQTRAGAAVVHVESAAAVSIADAGVSASLGYLYRIRQGVVRDVSFRLPDDVRLQSVLGPDVGGWELIGEGVNRQLRVFLRRNVNDQTQLTLECYLGQRVDPEVTFDVPNVTPLEITTEAGTAAIFAGDAFSLRTNRVEGLSQIEASTYQTRIPVSRPNMAPQMAYRFSRRPWNLNLTATRLATQMQVQIEQGLLVGTRKVRITTRAVCRLARMPRSSLTVEVPASWLVLDVQSAGLSDWYRLPGEDGQATLQLDFQSPQQGEVVIAVTATENRTPDSTLLDVQPLRFRKADRAQTQLALWFEEGLTGQVSDLGNWQPIDATTVSANLRGLQSTGAQLAFVSPETQPGQLELTLHQQKSRLSASSLTVINVTDVAIVYGLVLQWHIDRASTETLVVDLPNWLSSRLQFHGQDIRDARPAPLDELFTRWTITLRGPAAGPFRLSASASLPAATVQIPAPEVRFVQRDNGVSTPLEHQKHYALLINTSLSQLTSSDPSVTEPVQREDVDLVVRDSLLNQATEFIRLTTPGSPPSWTLQRYVPAADVPAAVNLADHVTLLARDGSYRAVATYTIKNRDRQFLPLRLPTQSRLLSVLVGHQPSRAVTTTIGNDPALLIALPKTSAVDLSFPVQVVYAGRLPKPLPAASDLSAVDIDLPSAEVIGTVESEEFGIPVARTQWTVYFPEDLQARPLSDPKRNNLNIAGTTVSTDSQVTLLISDAEEVLSAVDIVGNYRLKSRALSNLKQLDSALENYSSVTSHDAQLAETTERLKEAVSKLSREVDGLSDSDANRAEMSGVLFGNGQPPAKSGDASVQLGQAIANNGAIFTDNTNQPTQSSLDAADFRFQPLPTVVSGPRASDAKSLAEQAASKGNSLEARQIYQQFNEDQLNNLNGTIVSGKSVRSRQSGRGYFESESLARQQRGTNTLQLDQKKELMLNNGIDPFSNNSDGGRGLTPLNAADPFGVTTTWSAEAPSVRQSLDDLMPMLSQQGGAFTLGLEGMGGSGGMGGGVGMGGGIGGGGMADDDNDLIHDFDSDDSGWSQTGGLSLPIQLPTDGEHLVFSKAGGNAKLALRLKTVHSVQQGFGWLWAGLCTVLSIVVLAVLRDPARREHLQNHLPLMLAILSAIGVFLLPDLWQLAAWVVFVTCASWTAWTYRRSPSVSAE